MIRAARKAAATLADSLGWGCCLTGLYADTGIAGKLLRMLERCARAV